MTECLPGCLRPCRATFERLAREAPELLIAWVQTGYGLGDANLSFACEALGRHLPEEERIRLDYGARIALMTQLEHASPVVREGAVYGLAGLGSDSSAALHRAAADDPSPGVREAAQDALDSLSAPAHERAR